MLKRFLIWAVLSGAIIAAAYFAGGCVSERSRRQRILNVDEHFRGCWLNADDEIRCPAPRSRNDE